MMHQPSGGMGGTAADITIQAENMLHVKQTMQELIARHSGRSLEEIQRDWDRDRWFTAEQAREYGLIDRVVTRAEQLPGADGAGPRREAATPAPDAPPRSASDLRYAMAIAVLAADTTEPIPASGNPRGLLAQRLVHESRYVRLRRERRCSPFRAQDR